MGACCCSTDIQPVDYVDPYIGNISHLLVPTFPTVQLPNSMMRVFPSRADYTSEYLNGLPLLVTSHRSAAPLNLLIYQGEPREDGKMSYDNEHITPYSMDLNVGDGDIDVHYAPSYQSAIYEFVFNKKEPAMISFKGGEFTVEGNTVTAVRRLGRGGTSAYLFMEFEQQPLTTDGKSLVFDSDVVRMRYGASFISCDQAKANLQRELQNYDVKALASAGREIWNKALSRIEVKGGSEKQKTVLYTSYYRTLERPICISEDGRYWSAYDSAVHEDEGTPFYLDDWIWDTYRAAHPLRILMDRDIEENILASYLRIASQTDGGWLPTFPGVAGDGHSMNCNHTIASYADAYSKGLDFDVDAACKAAYNNLKVKTVVAWSGNRAGILDEFFWDKGYFPALKDGEKEFDPNVHSFEKRQPIAVSLGTAYDCWCMSQLAKAAGQDEWAKYFLEHSYNYRLLYKPDTKFFHPKDSDGNWIEPFDYRYSGGQGAREYYDENNAYVYNWDVQHNLADLVRLMGGNEEFIEHLDEMFAEPLGQSKYDFFVHLPDHTGNVGQFSMANEPSLHVPYLYNYAGAPWKTQKRIRQMLDTWFRDDLMGVPGDEDGGGMTSFVVFSSLGLYPVTPGMPVYNIGSPLFENEKIHLENGKVFEILAKNCSDDNKYIQSASLNGVEWDKPYILHEDVMKGGKLELVMGDKPNKEWGSLEVPPSAN